MNRLPIIFLFCMISFAATTKAQNNCDQNVKQAEEFFNNGDYENAVQILEKSIKECNFSKKKEEIALEILAKCYLEQDNIARADATVKNMLEKNPHYELKGSETHEDFVLLVKKFVSHPLFSIGIRNAALQPKFKVTKTYSILENVDYTVPYETAKTFLLYYAWAEYEFTKNISVNVEFINFSLNYNRSFSRENDWDMIFQENLSFIEIPLYLKKHFQAGKNIVPYASLGFGYLRMIEANATSYITYTNEDIFNGKKTDYSATGKIDMLNMRNKNTFEWIAGCGIGYKFKNLGIFLDAKYSKGFNSLTNSANRFNNTTLTNDYFYIDNSIQLNKVELGISISYTLKNSIRKVR